MPSQPTPDTGPWPDDAALLADLAEALRTVGQVPAGFTDAARAALTWRTVDDELAVAELVFDSATDPAPAGSVRSGGAAVRMLAFRGPDLAVEIEVGPDGIVGQLWPEAHGQVRVQSPDGPVAEATADPAGLFTLGPPPTGPLRLHARTDAYALVTSWVRLA